MTAESGTMCITTNQTLSPNPNPNPNPNPSTKQHAIVKIQLNIVVCPAYPEKCIGGKMSLLQLSVVVYITGLSR